MWVAQRWNPSAKAVPSPMTVSWAKGKAGYGMVAWAMFEYPLSTLFASTAVTT